MEATRVRWLHRWLPSSLSIDLTEGFRASIGALIGILVTGLVGLSLLGTHGGAVWLIAPMGASAVLLFAVPSSPLAQPWSIIGGNLIAAVVGVSAARWIDEPSVAAAAAIFVSIGLMLPLRCLHPPSGAVTLVAVLGGPDVHAMGYAFVATPVLLNSAAILATALLYNNLTGRPYPHGHAERREPNMRTLAGSQIGFEDRDLEAALTQYNQVLDVTVEDLGALFRRVEGQVFRRHIGEMQCRHVMKRDVVPVEFGTELAEAWQSMRAQGDASLRVVDRFGIVVGIVTRGDFLRHADAVDARSPMSRLATLLRRTDGMYAGKPEVVGQIMTSPVRTALDTSSIVELVPPMIEDRLGQVPIVDASRRLVGVVAQADVTAALYDAIVNRAAPLSAAGAAA